MCLQKFCERHSIPTAAHAVFHSATEAKAYLQQQQAYPVVIKADGLAGGKGVVIAEGVETACRTVDSMISDAQFGEAGLQLHRGSCGGQCMSFFRGHETLVRHGCIACISSP